MFTVALFIIAQNLKELKCPSTYEWIKGTLVYHTRDYYSVLLMRTELLTHTTTWINLKNVKL